MFYAHTTHKTLKIKKNSDQIIIFLFFGTGFFKKNKNNDINFEKFKQKKNPQSNCAKSQRNKIKKKTTFVGDWLFKKKQTNTFSFCFPPPPPHIWIII